jgi:predicted Zn-dependent peptidase
MKKHFQLSLLAAAVLVSGSTFAAASAKLPAELPPFAKDKALPVPQITKKTLSNGLEIWVVPRQGMPRVDYVLAVRGAGFTADGAEQPGFASLMAGLLNEGTAQRDSRAIAEAAQGMGGGVAASAGNDGVTVVANALTSNAAPMMKLMAEITRTPAFADREVALAKANALQSLKASEARPAFRATRALGAAVYGDHPYGRTQPTAEAISAVTPEALRHAHAARFRPERSLLVISGRITPAEAIKLAEAAFGDWKGTGTAPAEVPTARSSAPVVHVLLERPNSVQSTVRLGRPGEAASAADQVPLRLASTIIGGGFSSRVNINLREEKGYTYGASAGASSLRAGGAITGGADVRNDVTGASLKEFFSEYKRLGEELVGEEELAMNKRYVAGGYLISNQLQGAVARTLAGNWLVGLPSDFLGNYVPMIQQVTPEQVREAGKKFFSPESQSIVVVGDRKVLDQLKDFGEFAVK